MWHTNRTEYYPATTKNVIMPVAATWTDVEIIIRSEVRKEEKDKYTESLIHEI